MAAGFDAVKQIAAGAKLHDDVDVLMFKKRDKNVRSFNLPAREIGQLVVSNIREMGTVIWEDRLKYCKG